jgi:hypothetical protein
MKVNRQDLRRFLGNIRRKAGGRELTDDELAEELANYMEVNPCCVDPRGVSHPGRFSYSTVGYGVFSLMGERYRMGRVEVFDREDGSGYASGEGSYCMPHVAASQFEDFIESLETDLPMEIRLGSFDECKAECARDLGFGSVAEMDDPDKVRAYRERKNDEYARSQGYEGWDDLLSKSKLVQKKNEAR